VPAPGGHRLFIGNDRDLHGIVGFCPDLRGNQTRCGTSNYRHEWFVVMRRPVRRGVGADFRRGDRGGRGSIASPSSKPLNNEAQWWSCRLISPGMTSLPPTLRRSCCPSVPLALVVTDLIECAMVAARSDGERAADYFETLLAAQQSREDST